MPATDFYLLRTPETGKKKKTTEYNFIIFHCFVTSFKYHGVKPMCKTNDLPLLVWPKLRIKWYIQGSKLAVASSKSATWKSHLPPVINLGSKKLLPGNSVMKIISWKNKPIFTEIILLLIRQNKIPYGQRHYQCLWPYGILFSHTSDNCW